MKLVGALFLVVSAYVLGALIRAEKLRGEEILRTLLLFLRRVRDNIEYGASPLRELVDRCAADERYAALDFLPGALGRLEAGEPLKTALCGAFWDSDCATKLDKGDAQELGRLFEQIGESLDAVAVRSLDYLGSRLQDSLALRQEQNKKQKGFYESLCSLAGAAVAILLL